MIRTQIYLPEEMNADLRLLTKIEKVSFSDLIREGINDVIVKRKKKKYNYPLKGLVGIIKSGDRYVASQVNDIYK